MVWQDVGVGVLPRRLLLALHLSPALRRTWLAPGSTAHLTKTWELVQGLHLGRGQ